MNLKTVTACIYLVISGVMVLPAVVTGQSVYPNVSKKSGLAPDFVADKVAAIAVTPRGSNWLTFRADSRLSPIDIFSQYHGSFRFGPHDAMKLVKSAQDDLGFTHYRYQQTYKGIKVEGAEMLVHARDGHAVRINGGIVTGLSLGASQALLLKKIEELTLYMISMQRENEALSERVRKIEEK